MKSWVRAGMVLMASLGSWATPGWGQVRERDVTITGPRGRTIERRLRSERGPGTLDREIQIRRPEGTFQRDVHIERQAGVWGGPPERYGPPGMLVERDVVIAPRPPLVSAFVGLPFFNLFFGSPPPPIFYPPPPPPVVIYNPPQRYAPMPPQATVVFDPVADALGRLRSHHDHSRRDGAATLGRLGDARAVPALVERLRDDSAREVRVAAATALGEIGDPAAATPLDRARVYDKKHEVRAAAAQALARLPREAPSPAPVERVPPPPTPEPRPD